MEINYLKINGFGKLEDKEIELKESINLVCGKNESGKTTFLKFLFSMFFGASKNKNGKEIADYDKYMPWKAQEFSGKMVYKLDNGESFELFRDFRKKNPSIYNEKKEDISKKFNIDKTKGNEFFYEQTGLDEIMWRNTSLVEQQEIVLDGKSQNVLTQKISNLLSTGDDNVSYKKSVDKLNKKLIEEVGTERTTGRPINNVMQKIVDLNCEREELEKYVIQKDEVDAIKTNLKEELENKLVYIEAIKELKKIKEDEVLDLEKISIKNGIRDEYEEKINELKNELRVNEKEEGKETKKVSIFNLLIMNILIIANIVLNLMETNIILESVVLAITIIYLLVNLKLFMKYKKLKRKKDSESANKLNKIKNEIEINNKNRVKIEKEIDKLNKELKSQNQIKYNVLKTKFNRGDGFNELASCSLDIIKSKLEIEQNICNSVSLQIREVETEEKGVVRNLEKKAFYEEELLGLEGEKEELQQLETVITLAKSALETAYEKMKDEITPKFTEDLSKLMEKISDGKYKNISFSDESGLRVELDSGKYIDGNLLSIGTIDQLYLALRLSIIREISEERMPIILDESFVYYDKERLKNILEYLNKWCKKFQIILLSCSNREREVLEELGIKHNLIEL
ncbi:MAG: AAA family ATPase [Oscillospiraceae bacterium]|nr:AAA family ATPase [Oscillospiraceae bacterium]